MREEKPLTVKEVREFLSDKNESFEIGICINGKLIPLTYTMFWEQEDAPCRIVFMGPLFKEMTKCQQAT